ncbi:hypothetical protein [Cellulosilyticum sp. WCF-2]|uniref:hypothetical protein n=1 Tax=Cellulosilyticum sp. WCF-2 TaxID=2497860 RepID=UPI000F8D23EE|nr:hypothetical protein [Cellulosilyticum sp. WCF-2]QEH69901.1 hypothetical protein EKH84_16475 [Cellulosilyticum sp. WCF-2]
MSFKEKIIKIIDPVFFKEHDEYFKRYSDMVDKYKSLKLQNTQQTKILECINNIGNRDNQVLKIIDNDIVIFKENKSDIVVTANSFPYCNNFYCKILCKWNFKTNSIYIIDIYSNNINNGYGTIAMQALIENATYNGIKTITGSLSIEDTKDINHKERLLHYYTKNGFKIIGDELINKL